MSISSNVGEVFNGTQGNDTIIGTSADDIINAGGGSNIVTGGSGSDTFQFDLSDLSIDGLYTTVEDLQVNDVIEIDGDSYSADFVYYYAEQGRSLDTNTKTELVGEGDDMQIIIYGNLSDEGDTYYDEEIAVFNLENDAYFDLNLRNGTDGDDTITFENSDNLVYGGAGDDIINTADGDDVIDAGDGDDIINAGAGSNSVTGGSGSDTYQFDLSELSVDGLYTTVEDLQVNDVIEIDGNSYTADYVYYVAGAGRALGSDIDTELVGEGDDMQIILYSDSSDTDIAVFDEEVAVLNVENEALFDLTFREGTDGDDTLTYETSDNLVYAGAGDDIVNTGSGDDVIDAGDGDDTVNAGDGSNNVTGGAGSDTFQFAPAELSVDGLFTTVEDFQVDDFIEIDGTIYSASDAYYIAGAGRAMGADVDTELVGEGDNQQIILYGNSSDTNVAVFDEEIAVLNVTGADDWIV